jgi:hypothetical protein
MALPVIQLTQRSPVAPTFLLWLNDGGVSVALPIRVIPTLSAVESRNSAPDLAQGS